MNKDQLLPALQREINHGPADLKAESIVVLAMGKGLVQEDFAIASESSRRRPYSKDVLSPGLEEDRHRKAFLQLELSRDGWYDHLPEGLFHQPVQSGVPGLSAGEMAAEYVQNKQIELENRRFFRPFEQAFYEERVSLESEEFQLLKGLNTGTLNDFFMEFWGIDPAFPSRCVTPFIEMLPQVHKINGDPDLLAQCLEKIIQEPVEVKVTNEARQETLSDGFNELGHSRLGSDLTLGNLFWEESPCYHFSIGPLQHSRVEDYLEKGIQHSFLKVFNDFFLPVEAGELTQIKVSEKEMTNILEPHQAPILGYSFELVA
ncbi:type VI secretion system baseplate subunit TssG [Cyclobacterium roseum]|uniref:type VI secretion system baseplate subunit TssG n=1 Tax=Cyclobacterium roseum TaxID=2666137 RepID=UPI00139150BA|nr:type VI secretion system baseplate subunit TssG [Cyclobacterium roseum]